MTLILAFNFEPSFFNVLLVYLPLSSSSPSMTISYFCHDAKRRGGGGGGGGGPRLNVIMTLIFKKIVWKCPLTVHHISCVHSNFDGNSASLEYQLKGFAWCSWLLHNLWRQQ